MARENLHLGIRGKTGRKVVGLLAATIGGALAVPLVDFNSDRLNAKILVARDGHSSQLLHQAQVVFLFSCVRMLERQGVAKGASGTRSAGDRLPRISLRCTDYRLSQLPKARAQPTG